MLPPEIDCCSCGACAAICPHDCIELKENKEGFDYPVIDNTKCKNCFLCEKVCPILHPIKKIDEQIYTVVAQNLNLEIRSNSSAGGFVGALLSHVFQKDGVGYSVGYNPNNEVSFIRVTNIQECFDNRLFSSKYVIAKNNNIFRYVKKDLLNGRLVCFIGLPCQVEGLKKYLGKDYKSLISVDLTCYGCPSRKVYRKYLDYIEAKYKSKVSNVLFRDKRFGYSVPTMSVVLENGKIKSQNSAIKSYLRCFFDNISIRPSCYHCQFKGISRVSDLTIGDCKNIHDFVPEYDDDLGTTVVHVHTEKGKEIMKQLNDFLRWTQVSTEKILETCGTKLVFSAENNPKRAPFFRDIDDLCYKDLINKYCPPTFYEYIASIGKRMILLLHLNKTSILRKIKHR